MTAPQIRHAHPGDAAAIAAIYNQALAERQSTFETTLRSADDFAAPIRAGELYLVAEAARCICGWARLAAYSHRPCYSGVGEASIYVAREQRGRGFGRALFTALSSEAAQREYWKLVGLLFT